jgi:polyferredoxin
MNYFSNLKKGHIILFFFVLYVILYTAIVKSPLLGAGDKMLWHPEKKLSLLQYLKYSRFWLTVTFGLIGGMLLMLIKIKWWLRTILMVMVFIFLGILPAIDSLRCALQNPSPLCALIKPMLILKSGNTNIPLKFIVSVSTIGIFSIAGNKLFCGWICPIGAIQEAINLLPLPVKKIKLSFFWTNIFRILLFLLFIPILYLTGSVLYDFFNPFAPLRWGISADFLALYSIFFIGIVLIASIYLYRPYCYMICPIGFITWLMELITPVKVRINRERCDECKICVDETSCPTVTSILEDRVIRPDCHSCGRCIDICPHDALSFRCK